MMHHEDSDLKALYLSNASTTLGIFVSQPARAGLVTKFDNYILRQCRRIFFKDGQLDRDFNLLSYPSGMNPSLVTFYREGGPLTGNLQSDESDQVDLH